MDCSFSRKTHHVCTLQFKAFTRWLHSRCTTSSQLPVLAEAERLQPTGCYRPTQHLANTQPCSSASAPPKCTVAHTNNGCIRFNMQSQFRVYLYILDNNIIILLSVVHSNIRFVCLCVLKKWSLWAWAWLVLQLQVSCCAILPRNKHLEQAAVQLCITPVVYFIQIQGLGV